MKKIKFIFILFVIFLASCEDIFDKQPLDKISDSDVWNNKAMIEAYVTNMYARFPWTGTVTLATATNPRINTPFSHYQWFTWSDEATYASGNTGSTNVPRGGTTRSNDEPAFWDYVYIRDLSTFLEKIKDTPLTDVVKKQLEGEVRVIRAITYFEMQKRYGGVPLVDVVIDPFVEIDEKYTKRATEEAIADFIDSELNTAIGMLSETPISGRINKWSAYAYKARINLWAASIAKYGTVQINGLVGIPSARANEFYTKASEAAQAVISSGKYALYNKHADKSENYRNIFQDESNGETIFERIYDGVNIGHSWDNYTSPPSNAENRGGGFNPTLEFVLRYENIDGSATQPAFGTSNVYDNGFAPFANKDPRLHATVFFQGDAWVGSTVKTYEGIDPSVIPDPTKIISSATQSYQGMPSAGADSRFGPDDDKSTNSGFLVKKYLRPEFKVPATLSKTNWIAVRLAEMYLTVAEAEFEKGNLSAAATALNATRGRAGISLVSASTITMDKVRTERRSELAFEEGHRYWDLRRWRIAYDVLNAKRLQGLRIIYHFASGKYYFLPMDCESFSRVFKPEHYYNPITDGRITNNPDLVENPLY